MIKKETVLVRDNKGIFLKMFKRKFKNDFEFSEDSLVLKNQCKPADFDYAVFVVYDYTELVAFFELEVIHTNFVLCLFSKHLYTSLRMIIGIKELMLIDASKTKNEICDDLKEYFSSAPNFVPKLPRKKFLKFKLSKSQLEMLHKAFYYMM
ncbi:hypothetical protein [Flavobacterium agrisoli]|uniref:Uncharacterized protein n=1 Tax=Flavobacterium agrisoli TaxID=2793066 RepID=A0A934PIN3_9FLAO|nr:hypothetical protein [Flavobacterium agrisoli]MBK0368787.1 hypothetical protein [Flavobacterium agrisoli]